MTDTGSSLPPGAWLGCLGGGQLGRMFVHAAQRLGYHVLVLDPDAEGPAAQAADAVLVAAHDDADALDRLARRAAAVTTEFENVPAVALERLAEKVCVRPGAQAVRIAQDRRLEKRFLRSAGAPIVDFAVIETEADLAAIDPALLPGVLKTASLGYDGKGQARVVDGVALRAAWERLRRVPCVLEAWVAYDSEASVLLARAGDGAMVTWPVQQNTHRNGILARTRVPAELAPTVAAEAQSIARGIAEALDYVGVLCVEMFVAGDRVLVNELAPRPHNSGHYTIEAAVTSQFEQQVRVLAGLPLGPTEIRRPAVMVNLLGDVWFDAPEPMCPAWRDLLALPDVHLHLYGKAEPRRRRKMGHVTCLGDTLAAADALADRVEAVLRIWHESA